MHKQAGWRFDHSYQRLPEPFFVRVLPSSVREPRLVILNEALASELGLDPSVLRNSVGTFAGNQILEGADPIAQAYAGHQFGHFTNLGDGRAILLGEHLTPSGERFDIQLKGPGQTPYSRRGDGRAAVGPMLREYIISEGMHALGVPTTRSLAVVTTGEPVMRETPLPGAILTRVAASHIRVGTFEYAAALGKVDMLKALADYVIARHYPEVGEGQYLVLFQSIVDRQAALVAQWMLVGFVHGVMNTDNMAISGQTIDYGPCAFMESYDAATVFSSIDRHGRYAYGNQPKIAHWNLTRLGETLLPLIAQDPEQALAPVQSVLDGFDARFTKCWVAGMRAKLGLMNEEAEDKSLFQDLLQWMKENQADYTNTFRSLPDSPALGPWLARWQNRLRRQPRSVDESLRSMHFHNPAYIPRNHRVEEALNAAEGGDYAPLQRLLAVLRQPFADQPGNAAEYGTPARPDQHVYRTFCGT